MKLFLSLVQVLICWAFPCVDKYLLKVEALIIDATQNLFYMGCETCFASLNAEEKLLIYIYDDTGSLNVTVFGNFAAAITGLNALDCMGLYYKGIPFPVDEINQNLYGKMYFVGLKKRLRFVGHDLLFQYTVKSLHLKRITQTDSISHSYLDESLLPTDLFTNALEQACWFFLYTFLISYFDSHLVKSNNFSTLFS
ncbi:hypothetical protein ACJIZ3_009082 [Penstemon smallii]|uniref:Uncharacterized protein n=1 Tax=Penstemon smallii TaxID=265156 RepID=A0ABD3TCL3_9LAMI